MLPHTLMSRTAPHKAEVCATAEEPCKRGCGTSSDSPEQAQAPTGEPGEGTGVVGQLGHNHLVAGRATHLDRAVKKGDWLLHVDRLHGN